MPNRLVDQTSPYLRQHANNPVDWRPWGAEALSEAQARGCPILLSVGYSACHWCHVMERESFEDAGIAAQMNAGFVCVKVDREERPDLDDLYMKATQALNRGRGGWPMTAFLTPEGRPFFAGTYFPPRPSRGMPSFPQVMDHVSRLWSERRDEMEAMSRDLTAHIARVGALPNPVAADPGEGWLSPTVDAFLDEADPAHGGPRGAPKFPPHGALAALLASAQLDPSGPATAALRRALDGMAKGGVYDHVGGGFCRYSVDDRWCVPHFEKMLYDNAQLAPIYFQAGTLLQEPRYLRIGAETLSWGLRELRLPHGGFASSLDADSLPPGAEGGATSSQHAEEGAFYVWTPEELTELLGIMDGMRAAMLLGIGRDAQGRGSFEEGRSVVRLEAPIEELSAADQDLVRRALAAMYTRREARPRPARDDKALAAWNGMWIVALSAGATATHDRDPAQAAAWLDAAAQAARFLLDRACLPASPTPRLCRSFLGHPGGPAFAEDYAHLLSGLLALQHACVLTGRPVEQGRGWLWQAREVAEAMLRLFWRGGALAQRGSDEPGLIAESHPLISGAEPAANAVAAGALIRLAALTGESAYHDRAQDILSRYRPLLDRAPRALGIEAVAGEAAWRIRQVGLSGQGAPLEPLRAALRRAPLPFAVVSDDPELPWMQGKQAPAEPSAARAYVCERGLCLAPTEDPEELLRQATQFDAPAATRQPADLATRIAPRPTPAPDPSARPRAPELPADPAAWIGAPQQLAALRGRVVVLDFWTLCCVNCLHVLPELDRLEREVEGMPVAVIGVHSAKFPYEQERASVEAAVARYQIRHPVVLDPDHRLWEAYNIRGWPGIVVLDRRGRVAWSRSGEIGADDLLALCTKLLAEPVEGDLQAERHDQPRPNPTPHPDPAPDLRRLRAPGKIHAWGLSSPGPVLHLDAPHRVYVADTGNHRVLDCEVAWRRDPATDPSDDPGVGDRWPELRVRRIYGDGQPGHRDGDAPQFRSPQGISRLDGALYVADTGNHAIRRIDLTTHAVETLIGAPAPEQKGPTSALHAEIRSPWDVVAAPDGDGGDVVFIAAAGEHRLYALTGGQFGLLAGSGAEDHVDGPAEEAALAQPSGLATGGRYVFFIDAETSSVRVLDLAERRVGTVCGHGLFDWGDVDGAVDQALLQHPLGIALGEGELWIADTYNHKIKVIDLEQMEIRTVYGGPGRLSGPSGLAVLADHVLVADTDHHRIVAVRRADGQAREIPVRF